MHNFIGSLECSGRRHSTLGKHHLGEVGIADGVGGIETMLRFELLIEALHAAAPYHGRRMHAYVTHVHAPEGLFFLGS